MNRRTLLGLALSALTGLGLLAAPPVPAQRTLILATTTSTQDSGLLDVLVPMFEQRTGYFVKTIAVGSGQAMAMGQKGEADLLLVHSPEAEQKFLAEGYGLNRRLIMHNDFVVVGPPSDPAGIKGLKVTEAFKKLLGATQPFVSRGDNSGTHAQEKKLWKAAGLVPEGQKSYQQTGLGMGQTLNVAAEKKAYTLADRGTFLALRKNLGMAILVEGDASLLNVYHTLEVNPARFPKVNAAGAKALADFLVSAEIQALIGRFGVDKYGSPLFFPDAGKQAQ